MQIMECLKNYQLRQNLGNNIFLYYSFLFDSLCPIKSQIIWKQMTLTSLFHMGKGVGGADITPLSSNIVKLSCYPEKT